jgi:hypothetical protein
MADDKSGRDKQADDLDKRQRQRDLAEALERGDETEPEVEAEDLKDIEKAFEAVEFPATGSEVVHAVGTQTVEAPDGTYAVENLIPETEAVVFEKPAAVRVRIQRPTIAAAMKRVLEAADAVRNVEVERSQREAYEKTFRALRAIDADDDDEGIRHVADWIVEQIQENGTIPGSRAVRRKAADFCRSEGYEVRADEWLGV